jgi:hypothetical protein
VNKLLVDSRWCLNSLVGSGHAASREGVVVVAGAKGIMKVSSRENRGLFVRAALCDGIAVVAYHRGFCRRIIIAVSQMRSKSV